MFANPDDTRQYERGHVFFSLGEPGDVMYVVVSGEVEIAIKDKVVEVVGPGGVFGEMALIDRRPRSASAVAKNDVEAATIDQGQFLYLLRSHPTFSIEIMDVMAERLRALNEALHH